jgi:hypothetical protein
MEHEPVFALVELEGQDQFVDAPVQVPSSKARASMPTA